MLDKYTLRAKVRMFTGTRLGTFLCLLFGACLEVKFYQPFMG